MGTRPCLLAPLLSFLNHPHAYGDKTEDGWDTEHPWGSSPRVWGQAQGAAVFFRDDGIIPTRMGTSHTKNGRRFESQDHPHAYGDKLGFPIACCVAMGSSPRVWGQAIFDDERLVATGIIPTRMGTSYTNRYRSYPN